jgi:menaquinone-dependent protoporphyrinogen oxidase
MANILVAYASKHGQTAKIASRIATVLASRGHRVEIREAPEREDIDRADAVVLGAPIYYGRPSRALRRMLVRHRNTLQLRTTALFTVCLTEAGSDEHAKHEVRRIVDALEERTAFRPDEAAVFAGALSYRDYNPIVRAIMKRIAATVGANTDTSRDWEYTDWGRVETFALRLADRVESVQQRREAAAVVH